MPTEPFVPDGVWVPRAIVGIPSRFAVPLYLELRRHCYDRPECFPGVRRLARLVGCAVGTVSALTDTFHQLGIIKKLHDGRRCLYRFAKSCWRRRKGRKSAHRSVGLTEDKSTFGVFIYKGRKDNKTDISYETKAKRVNLIKTLRRWSALSPHLPDGERSHRLALLNRAEAALNDWHGRPAEDRRCFEMLVQRSRQFPLETSCVQSLRQRPLGMTAIGAFVPVFRRMPAA